MDAIYRVLAAQEPEVTNAAHLLRLIWSGCCATVEQVGERETLEEDAVICLFMDALNEMSLLGVDRDLLEEATNVLQEALAAQEAAG